MSHSERGSLWSRWDLHCHTPSSFDYEKKTVTNKDIVDRLVVEGIRLVAITDHNCIDIPRIRELQHLAGDRLTVLPGIELRSELGGKESVHFIGIFPSECDLADVWTKLSARARLTTADINKLGHDNVYCDLMQTSEVIHELGGVVTIHGHGKANSIEGIANYPAFKAQLKTDLLRDHVDILEIGVAERQDDYETIVFPAVGCELPLVVGSDNHDITKYSPRSACWVRADPNFRGLRMLLCEPTTRRYLGPIPPQLERVAQGKTKFIRSVTFAAAPELPPQQKWFQGTVEFNPGLVAIVGNKGSGKSALADTIGLLGHSKNGASFSFLSDERFRHPRSGLAHHFTGTLTWEDGTSTSKRLSDDVPTDAVERVKYLPQDHVEEVCNELSSGGEGGFEGELKAVIFSHVPESKRLNQSTLDDLVEFQTEEKKQHIDSLLKQLREISRRRAELEQKSDPVVRRELETKLAQKQQEQGVLEAAKPQAKEDPSADDSGNVQDKEVLKQLEAQTLKLKTLQGTITDEEKLLTAAERRLVVSQRLADRIANYEKDFATFKASIRADATELGLDPESLVTLSVQSAAIEGVRNESATDVAARRASLQPDQPLGLRRQLTEATQTVAALQSTLEGPAREYQAYLKQLAEWEEKKKRLIGNATEADSLDGINAQIMALEAIPSEIDNARHQQESIATQILDEKLGQVSVYQSLYGPVQKFIDDHPLAKHKLKLEFRAELLCDDFVDRLLSLLNQNAIGSFRGTDEGRAVAESITKPVKWKEKDSLLGFLRDIDTLLHEDRRQAPFKPVLLKDQLRRGRNSQDVFDTLYGLEYINPRYILRWEGKDLSVLSPGERGTLLLVFYLLMDKGEIPLVIDQPEGNLDNHTIAKALVDCIKLASSKRQVFIVTHNPNLAVVCDADQVVHAAMFKDDGSLVKYTTGALEKPTISKLCTDVLEGTHWAFTVRGDKYDVCRDIAATSEQISDGVIPK